jgi:DNA-binding NtrC family response regulator
MAGNILLVDDEEPIRDMLHDFLSASGYNIDAAESAETALRLLEGNDYDVLVVDKNMPGINGGNEGGLDLLRHVRSRSMHSEVIIMTGYPTVETAIEALRLGAFDYICKPFSMDELGSKIRRLMDYKRFVNSDYTNSLYRCFRVNIVELVDRMHKMTDQELEQLIVSLNNQIDKLFAMLRQAETIMLAERESLAHIAVLAERCKMDISETDSVYELLEKISELSTERL